MKVLYAFSGDPITYGHINIIKRAAKIFDNLTVAIGVNASKKYLFSIDNRLDMVRNALKDMHKVKIVSFQGLLAHYAYEHGFQLIIRGVRNAADFDFEAMLHFANESLQKGIETYPMFAQRDLSHVSSSAVKAIVQEYGFVHSYVPLYVKQKLEWKINKQYFLGLTGSIGTGKSWVGKKMVEMGAEKGIEVHNIELDHIAHDILSDLSEPLYVYTRNQIVKSFGTKVWNENNTINRKALGEIVFKDSSQMETLNHIMAEPMMLQLNRRIYGLKGIIILNSALLVEANMLPHCNNNVVLLKTKPEIQMSRLAKRGLTGAQINDRLNSQYTFEDKLSEITSSIVKDTNGSVYVIENDGELTENRIANILKDIQRGMN